MIRNIVNYFIAAVPLAVLMFMSASSASETQIEEFTLKAAYIEKFTSFVDETGDAEPAP